MCVLLGQQFRTGHADFAGVGNNNFFAANYIGSVRGGVLPEQEVGHLRGKTPEDFAVGIEGNRGGWGRRLAHKKVKRIPG